MADQHEPRQHRDSGSEAEQAKTSKVRWDEYAEAARRQARQDPLQLFGR